MVGRGCESETSGAGEGREDSERGEGRERGGRAAGEGIGREERTKGAGGNGEEDKGEAGWDGGAMGEVVVDTAESGDDNTAGGIRGSAVDKSLVVGGKIKGRYKRGESRFTFT